MNKNDQVTVLVNSCDRYEEAWLPFFMLLKKYWSDCPFPLALNTESKDFSLDGLEIKVFHSRNSTWGGRLSDALKQIKTPYVIVMLEDFFLQKTVRTDKVLECLDAMQNDDSIGVFYFSRITGYDDGVESPFPAFKRMIATPHYSRYYLNCQTALWSRDVLLTAVQQVQSPWELEEMKYDQIPNDVLNKKFYCSKTTWYDKIRDEDIFSYLLVRDTGYGIFKSQWLWNNKDFFKREGIPCMCETLPTISRLLFLKDKYISIIKQYLNLK